MSCVRTIILLAICSHSRRLCLCMLLKESWTNPPSLCQGKVPPYKEASPSIVPLLLSHNGPRVSFRGIIKLHICNRKHTSSQVFFFRMVQRHNFLRVQHEKVTETLKILQSGQGRQKLMQKRLEKEVRHISILGICLNMTVLVYQRLRW